jgi:hypothetical protein
MAGNTSTIDLKISGLREIRQELKTLQFELSQATDPEQMAQLSQRAGELRDNLNRANEQARVFAAGSPFEQTNNALGLMSSQIMSLDFEGAAESAKLFATAAKGINPGLMATQLKSLGSIVLTVGKAFMSMGASLLVNPIFLIAAAIVGIVTIIGVLLNKLGLLKPILNVIGKAFEFVKSVINAVVQSMKDFLDWLGLTSFAADEAAGKQAKAQEKVAQAFEDKRNKVVSAYDHEIALANIAGENTVDLEKKKQLAIILTSREQYRALEAQRDALKAQGLLTAEQSKSINEQMRTLREGIEGARKQIELINKKEVVDNKKKNEEVEKSNKDSYKKRIEEQKKYNQDRLTALRLTRDLELELLEDGIDKDLKLNKERYKRLIEDTRASETLNAAEKQKIVQELFLLESRYASDIAQKYVDIEKEKQDKITQLQKETAEKTKEIIAKGGAEMFETFQKQIAETIKADQNLFDARFDIAQGFISAISSLAGENKKVANALFLVDKALAIAQVVVSTQREIAGYAANPTWSLLPDGGAAIKASYISAAKIRAGISIATIAATSIGKFIGGGGGASVGGGSGFAGAAGGSTQAMQPSLSLFGEANQGNNASSSQSVEGSQSMTIFAKVSAVDMTAEQASNQKNMQMATL